MELDWVIGSIMESVKALGIMEDTIIVFSSDNGAACVGPVEQCGSNGPLLCCKQTTFDGGMRVPGILSWPGTVQPNQVNNDVTGLMDLFATGLHLAGIPIPSDRFIDGRNLLDLVKTNGAKYGPKSSPSGTHFFYRGDTLGAVRHGDYKVFSYREFTSIKPLDACLHLVWNKIQFNLALLPWTKCPKRHHRSAN